MLVDRAIIHVQAGNGGDGHVSFARYKYVTKGGPDGGDGGHGGSVYLTAAEGVDTLLDFSGTYHWKAEHGERGGYKQCTGATAADLEVRVPLGTIVYNDETGELLGDLSTPGQKLLVARGGEGGWGNMHFATPTHQAPKESTPGGRGEEIRLRLELKLIADIGIIGKPNAGKSTLLSRISRAHPKIANYPFTTLEPNLGIAELPGERRIVFADVPGLIEGAHEGHGLGIKFLRHVERTKLLVHLLEVEPEDGSDPIENYHVIRRELEQYSPVLSAKQEIIVLTKMDLLPTAGDRTAARKLIEEGLGGKTVIPISAASGNRLGELLEKCWTLLQEEQAKGEVELKHEASTPRERRADPEKSAPAMKEPIRHEGFDGVEFNEEEERDLEEEVELDFDGEEEQEEDQK